MWPHGPSGPWENLSQQTQRYVVKFLGGKKLLWAISGGQKCNSTYFWQPEICCTHMVPGFAHEQFDERWEHMKRQYHPGWSRPPIWFYNMGDMCFFSASRPPKSKLISRLDHSWRMGDLSTTLGNTPCTKQGPTLEVPRPSLTCRLAKESVGYNIKAVIDIPPAEICNAFGRH